jgi:hypothetical protein
MNGDKKVTAARGSAMGRDRAMNDFEYAYRKLSKCLYFYLGQTKRRGLGVFAARPFGAGAVVMIDQDGDYYDHVLSYRELCRQGWSLDMTLQVGLDAYKLPTGSLEDFTNHSCDPSTGVRLNDQGTIVIALRDIAPHEELTYDYSTYMNNPYEHLQCLCGSPSCRGVIGNFSTLPLELQRRYRALGIVGAFVDEPLVRAGVAD